MTKLHAPQIEFLKILCRMEQSRTCQVVMATHAPMLKAFPEADLPRLTRYGLDLVTLEQTDHYRLLRGSCAGPSDFIATMLEE